MTTINGIRANRFLKKTTSNNGKLSPVAFIHTLIKTKKDGQRLVDKC